MSARTMHVQVSTPAGPIALAGVTHLRFTTWDGLRGVMPGHEPAQALLCEAALEVTVVGDDGRPAERFIACEEGLLRIDREGVEIAARWAAEAATLEALAGLVDDRARARRALEAEARALARHREIALQEALSRLARGGAG